MKTSLKLVLSLTAALCAAPFASAQVTLHDFTSFVSPDTVFMGDWELTGDAGGTNSPRASFSQGAGFYNFVGGLDDAASGATHFFTTPLNITGLSLVQISALTLRGNTAPNFTVSLFDSMGEGAFARFETAAFAIPFQSVHEELNFSVGFDFTDVVSFSLSGGVEFGASGTLNLAVNHLAVVAVPEPATYGAAAALVLLGVVAVRRRRRSAA